MGPSAGLGSSRRLLHPSVPTPRWTGCAAAVSEDGAAPGGRIDALLLPLAPTRPRWNGCASSLAGGWGTKQGACELQCRDLGPLHVLYKPAYVGEPHLLLMALTHRGTIVPEMHGPSAGARVWAYSHILWEPATGAALTATAPGWQQAVYAWGGWRVMRRLMQKVGSALGRWC